ncbi:reverse transcriptase domain-containing protein [Tanacetum coccineum]|uniref:Reverse transcriptase domain-containing protein n=1 Tax=Tanacetum coccineum TaxID=301880 RepID=A0ABQ4WKG1_9ASTR
MSVSSHLEEFFFNNIDDCDQHLIKLLSYEDDECEQQFKANPKDFEKYLPKQFFNTITDHQMEEPETESDSDERLPFKTEKINNVKSEYRKGESSKNKSRNYEFRMPMHKGIPNKNSSSSGAINILNLDCISDLTERKRILEKWSTEISLILQTNQDDFQTAKSVLTLIEHKTEGNIQSLVKQAQWNEDLHGIDFFDSVIDILYTMFVGIDYHGNKDLEIIKEQEQARRNLTRVQLVNICSLDEYTCVYEKNIYKIPLSEHLQWIEAYLMKIPIISEQTIQRWKNEGNVISKNSLAFATRLAKEEITKICDTRYKQKKLKSKRKRGGDALSQKERRTSRLRTRISSRARLEVMAISVISVSSDSFEDSVRTPAGRVILFGTIHTTIPDTTPVITPPTTQTDTTVIPTETPIIAPTIPLSPDYTPASPNYSPASDSESDPSEDPSSDHIPLLPPISPFLSSTDNTTESDTPDTPPSPTHGTPFTEITSSTQRSPIIPRHRVMILAPRQPIPHGRPYRYHLNGPVHMMTARKRVRLLPVQQLAVRHSVNHSSSDYFSSDDSAQDSSSDSSSEASLDFHSNASSDSSSRHSLSDHSSPDLSSTSARPSRKRRRSPMTSALPPVVGALSPIRADLIPLPKRIRGVDVEDESSEQSRSRGTDIEVDDDVERSDGMDIDPVEAVIEACFDFADIIRTSGVDVWVEAVTVPRDDVKTGTRDPIIVSDDGDTPPVVPEEIPEPAQEGAAGGTYETLGSLVQRFHDHTQAIPVHHIQVIEGVQREQGHMIIRVKSTVTALTERVAELERDNRRLRGTASVES